MTNYQKVIKYFALLVIVNGTRDPKINRIIEGMTIDNITRIIDPSADKVVLKIVPKNDAKVLRKLLILLRSTLYLFDVNETKFVEDISNMSESFFLCDSTGIKNVLTEQKITDAESLVHHDINILTVILTVAIYEDIFLILANKVIVTTDSSAVIDTSIAGELMEEILNESTHKTV